MAAIRCPKCRVVIANDCGSTAIISVNGSSILVERITKIVCRCGHEFYPDNTANGPSTPAYPVVNRAALTEHNDPR